MNAQELIEDLEKQPEKPLLFELEGYQSKPGYHITEVKHATVTSLDCGLQQHRWSELNIQLLDGVAGNTETPVTNHKFTHILNTAIKSLPLDDKPPQLYVEFSPDNVALRKLTIQSVQVNSDSLLVKLTGESAICKPFQRAVNNNVNPIASACCSETQSTADSSESRCCSRR